MLELALQAALPMISVYTEDTVNVERMISTVADRKAQEYMPTLKPAVQPGQLYYVIYNDRLDLKQIYQIFTVRNATLVVVNPTCPSAAFDAGVLTTPPSMIEKFVQNYGEEEHHDGLMAAMAGLSYEQVFQISKLAMAKHQQFTPRAVRDIRRTFFGAVRGLQMLSTDFLYYYPNPALSEWVSSSGRFLTEFDEPLLTPRGLLFNGPPGTGKTMGAKYIALTLDLPLYQLDIAGLMEKYVGESEKNLRIALRQAEQSAPCVMLIDEVEKLFGGATEDSGVSSRMLSIILWWLQEHKAKVFTILTTNKESSIPPELYRPGRIDSEVNFTEMKLLRAIPFANKLSKILEARTGLSVGEWTHSDFHTDRMSHAAVTKLVTDKFKTQYLASKLEGHS
jgi:hypothetical protein